MPKCCVLRLFVLAVAERSFRTVRNEDVFVGIGLSERRSELFLYCLFDTDNDSLRTVAYWRLLTGYAKAELLVNLSLAVSLCL